MIVLRAGCAQCKIQNCYDIIVVTDLISRIIGLIVLQKLNVTPILTIFGLQFKFEDCVVHCSSGYSNYFCNTTNKFLFIFSANNPDWIPYAIMASTILSLPLMAFVKEEYNRAILDTTISISDPPTPILSNLADEEFYHETN